MTARRRKLGRCRVCRVFHAVVLYCKMAICGTCLLGVVERVTEYLVERYDDAHQVRHARLPWLGSGT